MNAYETETLLHVRPAVNLVQLAASLLRSKRSIFTSSCLFALLALVFALLLTPQYEATTEILPPQQSKPNSAAALMSQLAIASDAGGLAGVGSAIQAKSAADMYAVILAARPSCDQLIRRFDLQRIYSAKTVAQARKVLARHTTITVSKEGFISVSVRDRDPHRALALADGYVEELHTLMGGLALTEASQRRVFYEAQLSKTQEDLAHAEIDFRRMQQENKVVSIDLQAKSLIEGAATLRAQIAAKQVEVQSLRTYSTEVNPHLQIAEKQLNVLETQLQQLDRSGDDSFTGMSLNHVPDTALNFLRASRTLKYQESLYDLFVKQYEGSRLDEAHDAPLIQVIEPAVLPESRYGPGCGLLTFAGFLFGLSAGLCWTIIRAWRAQLNGELPAHLRDLQRAATTW